MRIKYLVLPLVVALWTVGCDCSKELLPLQQALEIEKQAVAKRELAAQSCADKLDSEVARNDDLGRRIRSKMPLSLPPTDVIPEDVLVDLPRDLRIVIEDRINEHLIEVTREIDELMEMNKSLRQVVVSVGSKVEKTVEKESQMTREQTDVQAAAIEEKVTGQQERLQTYLNSIERVSGIAEGLIGQINDFDQSSINCKGCWSMMSYRNRKRTILDFHAGLIDQIAELQKTARTK